MLTLYTTGYERRPLAEFIGLLQSAGVDAVIDVRLRNTSHLAGYTKRDDLAFLLREGFGIAYEHHSELAPTAEILSAYREDQDWPGYVTRFTALLAERQADTVGRDVLARYRAPCLLCYEAVAEQCHRRLVVEMWAAHIAGLIVVHL
ncbi:MAG TPA: DUF488 domain-containing protein [Anaerolineae bacterium]|nr:DUF488 domain-containing protein [Anaerolineae bacterium]